MLPLFTQTGNILSAHLGLLACFTSNLNWVPVCATITGVWSFAVGHVFKAHLCILLYSGQESSLKNESPVIINLANNPFSFFSITEVL